MAENKEVHKARSDVGYPLESFLAVCLVVISSIVIGAVGGHFMLYWALW